MLRSQSQATSGRASPKGASPKGARTSSNLDVTELVNSLFPLISQNIQESVAANINDEFKKVNDCISSNLTKTNEKLNGIGETHERIEAELIEVSKSVAILKTSNDETTQKLIGLENELTRNTEEITGIQSTIENLIKEKKILEKELDNLKNRCFTQQNFEERVAETVSETIRAQQEHCQPQPTENEKHLVGLDIANECRLENMEQYSRRDCLLFFGLLEMEYEDCTEKVVQTAQAMGVNITTADVSISHRLHTRTRPKEEPRPIIVKFLRRSVKNEVFQSKHHL